jgi:hypothetical protein
MKNDQFSKFKNLLQTELAPIKTDIKILKGDLGTVKKDVAKTRKDVDVMLSMFDREYLELRKRVERIEEHLNLTPVAS